MAVFAVGKYFIVNCIFVFTLDGVVVAYPAFLGLGVPEL